MPEKLVYNRQVKKERTLYEIVSRIPVGKVSTYGRLARLAGLQSPRQIGKLLHQKPVHARRVKVINSRIRNHVLNISRRNSGHDCECDCL